MPSFSPGSDTQATLHSYTHLQCWGRVIALGIALLSTSSLCADAVKYKDLWYRKVSVRKIESGSMHVLINGRLVRMRVGHIQDLKLQGLPGLENAEHLLQDEAYDRALSAYRILHPLADEVWMTQWINYRLIRCADELGDASTCAGAYLNLAESSADETFMRISQHSALKKLTQAQKDQFLFDLGKVISKSKSRKTQDVLKQFKLRVELLKAGVTTNKPGQTSGKTPSGKTLPPIKSPLKLGGPDDKSAVKSVVLDRPLTISESAAALQEAKAVHAKQAKAAQLQILASFDLQIAEAELAHLERAAQLGRRIKEVAKTGNLYAVKKLIAQKKSHSTPDKSLAIKGLIQEKQDFVNAGIYPQSPLMLKVIEEVQQWVRPSYDGLIRAYQSLVSAYTMKLQIDEATAVQDEMKAFIADRPADMSVTLTPTKLTVIRSVTVPELVNSPPIINPSENVSGPPEKILARNIVAPTSKRLRLKENNKYDPVIKAMIDYLYSQQNTDGSFKPDPANDRNLGGYSAVAVLALLEAGQTATNPKLAKAIEYLMKVEMEATYAVALRTQIWANLGQDYFEYLKMDQQWLMSASNNHNLGLFNYTQGSNEKKQNRYDHSVTAFGVKGLWAASGAGIKASPDFWKNITSHYLSEQNVDGGWGYSDTHRRESYESMTAAGLNVLLMSKTIDPRPLPARTEAIDAALKWLDGKFTGATTWHAAVQIQAAALMTGQRSFNNRDWSKAVCDKITQLQVDGALRGGHGGSITATSFGLMFLARSRGPIWITRIKTQDTPHEENPLAFGRLTKHLARHHQRDLRWQSVSIDDDPKHWQPSPVALMSLGPNFKLTAAQLKNLKQYLDGGGTLICNPQMAPGPYQKLMMELADALYPQAPLRLLDVDHPLLQSGAAQRGMNTYAVSNGTRDVIIWVDRDVVRYWQIDDSKKTPPSLFGVSLFEWIAK